MTAEFVLAGGAPCTGACPAGVNVQSYVGLIAQGKFREAVEVVRRALPFPGICGRVCPAPCESACERVPNGGAIAIRALKRFIADVEQDGEPFTWSMPPVSYPEKVALVGAGPAGVTAALDLRRQGYAVTIFEARNEVGGMLSACLPSFRLPRDVIRNETEAITSHDGIEVKTGVRVGRDVALSEILEQGYSAILVAIGAHRSLKLGVANEDAKGVVDALSYLCSDGPDEARKRVLVIGGGSTAMDAARTALRRGCDEVRVLYRRTRLEMPAAPEEVEHALQEGVILQTLVAPSAVVVKNKQVAALSCERTRLGEPDESGRRRPVIVPDSQFEVLADRIIPAIGQEPDPETFSKLSDLIDKRGRVKADADTLQTENERIFSAGDAVLGPATIIQAVGQAHKAATAIHRFLRTGSARPSEDRANGNVWQLRSPTRDYQPRVTLPLLPPDERRSSYDEVESSLNAAAAMAEAKRCLKCGACTECQLCSSGCVWRAASVDAGGLARVERALLPEDTAGARVELDGVANANGAKALISLACAVRADLCRGCGKCVEVCDFDAVNLEANGSSATAKVARIEPALCRGCGICVAECPSGAMDAGAMADAILHQRLSTVAEGSSVVIRCQWRLPFEDDRVTDIQVPCAGRVSAGLIARALAQGARSVTVATCEHSECKYGQGAKLASERLQWLLACEPDRVRLG